MKPTTGYRLLLAGLLVVITALAVGPPVPLPDVVTWPDKVNHALAFLALGFAADRSFPDRPFDATKVVPLLAYGIAIEFVQSGMPQHYFEGLDMLADTAGLLLYGLAARFLFRRRA